MSIFCFPTRHFITADSDIILVKQKMLGLNPRSRKEFASYLGSVSAVAGNWFESQRLKDIFPYLILLAQDKEEKSSICHFLADNRMSNV